MKKLPPKLPKQHWAGPTETIWLLVDVSNSNPKSKNYLWWFETRKLARSYQEHMRKTYGPTKAQLIGPYQYKAVRSRQKKSFSISPPRQLLSEITRANVQRAFSKKRK